MRLLARRKTPIEELKDAAIRALVNALDEDDDERAAKPGTKGVRALVAGAVIYTAGRAAFKGRRFVREQLSSDDQAEGLEDEEETRVYEEPDAGDRGPSGDEQEEPQRDEDSQKPEARREPDHESSSKTPTPLPERTPKRRAARRKGAQPSLTLPKQRRARTWV